MNKILITGGAGFIGSHLANELAKCGNEVVVFDNLANGSKSNLSKDVAFIEGDIMDINSLRAAINDHVEIIFHLAADVTIRESFSHYQNNFITNTVGTMNVYECATQSKTVSRLIYTSSMAVYSDSSEKVSETHETTPSSPYGVSKLASELYLKSMSSSAPFSTTVLRLFNAFGPHQKYSSRVGLITILTNKLLSNETPVLFDGGLQTRDFIHVDDIVRALILAIKHDKKFDIFNIGSGTGHKVAEVYDEICHSLSTNKEAELAPARPGEANYSVADITKAQQMLDFHPKSVNDFKKLIDKTVKSIESAYSS